MKMSVPSHNLGTHFLMHVQKHFLSRRCERDCSWKEGLCGSDLSTGHKVLEDSEAETLIDLHVAIST